MVIGYVLLGLALAYGGLIGSFALGFRRVVRSSDAVVPAEQGQLPFVSVIVPARDEADVISNCISTILANDYPAESFELIVVDDLSNDDTAAIVKRAIAQRELVEAGVPDFADPEPTRLTLLQTPEDTLRTRAHKKRAIARGIDQARGDIILTTDADCTLPTTWISSMAAAFDSPEVAFVSGPVHFRDHGDLWSGVQALDFLGLMSFGAGAIGVGRPNLCNGANVAYRRDVFLELGGFDGIDHLTSGDDELLMQKIAYQTNFAVRYCAENEAAVWTEPVATFDELIQQRKRWASKGAHYPHRPLVVQAVAIYAFCVALLLAAVSLGWAIALWPFVLAAFAIKVAADTSVIFQACKHYGRMHLLRYLPIAAVVHVPYIVLVGAAGALGGYRWKGRQLDR